MTTLLQYTTLFLYLKFQFLYEMTKIPCVYIINEELYSGTSCPYIIAHKRNMWGECQNKRDFVLNEQSHAMISPSFSITSLHVMVNKVLPSICQNEDYWNFCYNLLVFEKDHPFWHQFWLSLWRKPFFF